MSAWSAAAMSVASNSRDAPSRRKRLADDEVENSVLCSAAGLSDAGVGRILGQHGLSESREGGILAKPLQKRGASPQRQR